MEKNKTILVSPLNWGLGHATRMTPVIHHLQKKGFRMVLAADGAAYHFLKEEFHDLKLYLLPGAGINYGKRLPLALKMLVQLPAILRGIRKENKALSEIISKEKVDLIISDNRYGLYHPAVKSIFVTHQVNILIPRAWAFARPLVRYLNRRFINKFSWLWIPDNEKTPTLSGRLSHPAKSASPASYIGPLSRLSKVKNSSVLDFLIMLSGPEPQRTELEKKILNDPHLANHKAMIVRGLPSETHLPEVPEGIAIFNHLPAKELSAYIGSAAFIISRSGYSTVMDLFYLQKQAVFVPTPGQTEQEYLAQHRKGNSYDTLKQKDFSLQEVIVLGNRLMAPTQDSPAEMNTSEMDKTIKILLGENTYRHTATE